MAHHRIDVFEEIGEVYRELLRAAGVEDTKQMLDECSTPSGRRKLSQAIGVSEAKLYRWSSLADLVRIQGVDPPAAELLERAGVDNVFELRRQEPERLVSRMSAAKRQRKLSQPVPPISVVRTWVEESRTVDARLER